MLDALERLKYLVLVKLANEEERTIFESLGNGSHYTDDQKDCAFYLIEKKGIRATAKILKIPRRTLQRWCRQYGIRVKRCPEWVYKWAERRRKRKAFWENRGYY